MINARASFFKRNQGCGIANPTRVRLLVARFLEQIIEYAIGDGTISGFPEYVTTHFTWHRFAAIQIWIFVLFLVYTFVTELNVWLGEGELARILFNRRSSKRKPSWRSRVQRDAPWASQIVHR